MSVAWSLVAAIEDTLGEVTDLREMVDEDTAAYRAVDRAVEDLDDALQIAKANASTP